MYDTPVMEHQDKNEHKASPVNDQSWRRISTTDSSDIDSCSDEIAASTDDQIHQNK